MKKKLFAVFAILALLVVGTTPVVKAQSISTYNSTAVQVDIGVATKAKFGFGPVSSPFIGATVVFISTNYAGTGTWTVYTHYATVNQQSSGPIPLTASVAVSKDPDGDSNQYTAATIKSAQPAQVGNQTFTLNSASFQSEHVGEHNQNETLGGAAQITVQ
jgi:hypothetical protein